MFYRIVYLLLTCVLVAGAFLGGISANDMSGLINDREIRMKKKLEEDLKRQNREWMWNKYHKIVN